MKLNAATRLYAAQKLAAHTGRILFLGFGGVGQCMLPAVLKNIQIDPSSIIVLDKEKHEREFAKYANSGIHYIQREIVKSNLDSTLSEILTEGDFLINLSLNIDGIEIVRWCLEHGVLYIDTSIERWPSEQDEKIPDMAQRTLYATHQEMRAAMAPFRGQQRATCIVTHGANPGLVSHLTKAALLKIAKDTGLSTEVPTDQEGWAQLASATGTKIIQVAERDTQILKDPKKVHEFVNTWSCEGFWAEGRAPAEMGWGTHEAPVPENGNIHLEGPRNAAYLNQPGVATLVKSWVPQGGTFNGFLIQHSESITISEYLTTKDQTYRPTVYYAYQPTDAAIASVHEMRGQDLWLHRKSRVAKNSILSGIDELGVLLLGHERNALWYGSQLGIDESRAIIPEQNATCLQVVGSLLGAMVWAIQNPQMGYTEPESIPFDFVLRIAAPFLGPVAAVYSDWNPLSNRASLYGREYDSKNLWSFENFVIGSKGI
jgi:homospermidine synthase